MFQRASLILDWLTYALSKAQSFKRNNLNSPKPTNYPLAEAAKRYIMGAVFRSWVQEKQVSQTTPPNLGSAIKQRRKEMALNLNQLAELSSVSRSMLSEIERGNANPSFSSLWNITQALGVSIDELTQRCMENSALEIEHQSNQNTPRMLSTDEGCELRALNPLATASEFEWYELRIQPGSSLDSDAHSHGTREHLSIMEGELQVMLNNQLQSTGLSGDTLRYPADVQHQIINTGKAEAHAILVMHKTA